MPTDPLELAREAEHELKTWPGVFSAIKRGDKRFEYRYNDRGFHVGDRLRLREYNPATGEYTGRELRVRVTYIARCPDFGIPDGYVVMSIYVLEAR